MIGEEALVFCIESTVDMPGPQIFPRMSRLILCRSGVVFVAAYGFHSLCLG